MHQVDSGHQHKVFIILKCSQKTLLNSIGTLRSEDGDGRESVAEKVNSRSFNLHHDYSKSLTLSNVGEPSWSRIPKNHIQVQKERGNFVVACLLPLYILSSLFTILAKTHGRMTTIMTFSRQNDAGSRANTTWCWENLVHLNCKNKTQGKVQGKVVKNLESVDEIVK